MNRVLLHSCCAPCSAAILEWMTANGYAPTIYFYNPNIYPEEEYMKRKAEIIRYAGELGLPVVDEERDGFSNGRWRVRHEEWLGCTVELASEPERGKRCLECFRYRLLSAARYATEHDFPLFATTLASSRWKSLDQIVEAGRFAEERVQGKSLFWDRNWRKGGLYERRNILAKQFYNQTYCGCEFSMNGRNFSG